MVVAVDGQQRALGRVDVQPLGKEHVDLVDVLLERGVAGRVVLHVVGGAQTFAGVEGNVGGLAAGFAARGARVLRRAGRGAVGQRPVVVPGRGQQQLGQLLVAQDVEDEAGQDQRGEHGRRVENAAQPLPALALRVEEYLFIRHGHGLVYSTVRESRGNGLRYTVRIVWKLPPRVNRRPCTAGAGTALARLAAVGSAGAGRRRCCCALWMLRQVLRRSTATRWSTAGWRRTCCCTGGMRSPLRAGELHSDADPAARLSAVSGALLSALRDGELRRAWPGCRLRWSWPAACCWRISRAALRRRRSHGAAQCTLWLAALCPFTAVYAAAPLTETPTLFVLALALWAVARFHANGRDGAERSAFTFAVTYAALLRPDGALVARGAGAGAADRDCRKQRPKAAILRGSWSAWPLVCVLLALLPFAAWTWRNWQVFHVFRAAGAALRQPIRRGHRYPGWQRWVKTWCLDFVSTYEIYWNVPGGPLDLSKLPEPGLRLARAVCRDRRAGRGLQRQRTGPYAGDRRALCASWPRSASPRTRCAIMFGCRWGAWPTCGCGRASRTCPSIWTGGSTRITMRRRASVGPTRG